MDYSAPSPPISGGRRATGGKGGGGGELLLGIVGLLLAFVVGAGYVVASEMLTHHYLRTPYTDHSWTNVLVFFGVSIALVVLAARLWGFLPGLAAGLAPALPLYHATKGGVGFWYIALNGGEDPTGNVFASWIAVIGMAIAHAIISWSVQPKNLRKREFAIRFKRPVSLFGIVVNVVAAVLVCAFYFASGQAIEAF